MASRALGGRAPNASQSPHGHWPRQRHVHALKIHSVDLSPVLTLIRKCLWYRARMTLNLNLQYFASMAADLQYAKQAPVPVPCARALNAQPREGDTEKKYLVGRFNILTIEPHPKPINFVSGIAPARRLILHLRFVGARSCELHAKVRAQQMNAARRACARLKIYMKII